MKPWPAHATKVSAPKSARDYIMSFALTECLFPPSYPDITSGFIVFTMRACISAICSIIFAISGIAIGPHGPDAVCESFSLISAGRISIRLRPAFQTSGVGLACRPVSLLVRQLCLKEPHQTGHQHRHEELSKE